MMRYSSIPLRKSDGQQLLADTILDAVWQQIVAEWKVASLFYSGGINSAADFLAYIKKSHLHVIFAVESATSQLKGIGWLTNVSGGTGFVHYCMLGPPRRSVGKAMLDYWCGLRRTDGQPWLHVLMGITPEYHTAALRVIRIMGFTSLETIPSYCVSQDGQGRCGAVISYLECGNQRSK